MSTTSTTSMTPDQRVVVSCVYFNVEMSSSALEPYNIEPTPDGALIYTPDPEDGNTTTASASLCNWVATKMGQLSKSEWMPVFWARSMSSPCSPLFAENVATNTQSSSSLGARRASVRGSLDQLKEQ